MRWSPTPARWESRSVRLTPALASLIAARRLGADSRPAWALPPRAWVDSAGSTRRPCRWASTPGPVQSSARVVETALHKLHELGVHPARVRSGWGCCPLAPVAADDPAAIGRTNDAVLYGGTVHLWVEAADEEAAELAQRLPSSASEAFGTPFGELLAAADWNFYDIDPMLFSPAAVTLTSTRSGRAHHGGGLAPEVLERSFAR